MQGGAHDELDPGWAVERVAKYYEDLLLERVSPPVEMMKIVGVQTIGIEELLARYTGLPRWELLSTLIETELDVLGNDREREATYLARFPEFQSAIEELLSKPMPVASRLYSSGERIGNYEVESLAGRGAGSQVYRARHVQTHRTVAIKLLRADWESACGADYRERFRLEAEYAQRLNHPSIVRWVESGEHDSLPYHVFEYVSGVSLREYARHKILSPVQAAGVIAQVAEAVHHAHRHGIVHRDLKPDNILLADSGSVFVTDFGIALDQFQGESHGAFMGTLKYMSPEQARGMSHRLDGRADVFALGVILYELTTGTHPFGAHGLTTEEMIRSVDGIAAPPLRQRVDVPIQFERICLKSLCRDPADRFATAADFARALRAFTLGQRLRQPYARLAIGMTLLAACLLVVQGWYRASGQPDSLADTARFGSSESAGRASSEESTPADLSVPPTGAAQPGFLAAVDGLLSLGIAQTPEADLTSAATLIVQHIKSSANIEPAVWHYFTGGQDNTLQALLIERCASSDVPVSKLTKHLLNERDSDIRFALLLAIGNYGQDRIEISEREALIPQLLRWYSHDPDAGVHGATAWLLRRWGAETLLQQQRQALLSLETDTDRQWDELFCDVTMVRLPGSSPTEEPEVAIAACEMSRTQWSRLMNMTSDVGSELESHLPKNDIAWHSAAEFCNRLSCLSGLPESQWCYRRIDSDKERSLYTEVSNAEIRAGFRLPTIQEWMRACRAGSSTRRYWGNSEKLSPSYANYRRVGSRYWQPIASGTLMPNRLGLFDTLGNLSEWMHERVPYSGEIASATSSIPLTPTEKATAAATATSELCREIRGGSAWTAAAGLAVDAAYSLPEKAAFDRVGLRVARTVRTPASQTAGLEAAGLEVRLFEPGREQPYERYTFDDIRPQYVAFSLGRLARGASPVCRMEISNRSSQPLTLTRLVPSDSTIALSETAGSTLRLPKPLLPGESLSVGLLLRDRATGYLSSDLQIEWQDEAGKLVRSRMEVAAYFVGPSISVTTLSLDDTGRALFDVGTLPVARLFRHPIVVRNWGDELLKISSVRITPPFRIVCQTHANFLQPLEFGAIDVEVDTTEAGEFTSQLVLETNDPVTPRITVEYRLRVAEIPSVAVLGVYRRGLWLLDIDHDGLADTSFKLGPEAGRPLTGDFDGDGLVDFAVVHQRIDGRIQAVIRNARSDEPAQDTVRLYEVPTPGVVLPTAIEPLAADVNRDGQCDLGIVRRENGQMKLLFDCDGDAQFDQTFTVEADCDRALVADWDLDGTMDLITVSLKHTGLAVWQVRMLGSPAVLAEHQFGLKGDEPIVGDWNGDGRLEPGIFRARPAPTGFYLDWNKTPETDFYVPLGREDDYPVSFQAPTKQLRYLPMQ